MTVLDADAQGKQTDKESQFSVGSLTDWLINPEEYEPVVALKHRKTHSSWAQSTNRHQWASPGFI